MEIQVFGKEGCGLCQTTKNKFEHFIDKFNYKDKVKLVFVDMGTVDGLTEGTIDNVSKIPTTLFKKNGTEIARWEGVVPNRQEFEEHFKSL